MKNIELKTKINNPTKIEKLLKDINAEYIGTLNQKDTYFNSKRGRLKLREINNKNFELIFYIRSNKKINNNMSNYFIVPLDKKQKQQIKNTLTLSMGIKTIVLKSRKLWLFKNTRVHIDRVKNLGNFLELETVLEKISENKGKKEFSKIYNLLELDNLKKIHKSYSDMLPLQQLKIQKI